MPLEPPRWRETRLALSAGPLHVRELGPPDGPPVVFVHGVLASAALWDAVAAALGDRHRAILLDLPLGAHREPMRGDADLSPPAVAALILEALDGLGLGQVTLVGNDSGGALCQLVVARAPERCRALVLTSCDAYDVWLPLTFKPFELAAFVPGALFVVAQLLRLRPIRRLPFALGWLAKRMPEALGVALTRPLADHGWVRRDLAKFLRGISPRLTQAAAQTFRGFPRPVLLLWSREDRFFPARLAERLEQDFPAARLEWVDDAYTFSPLDAPEPVAAHLRAFLERLG